MPPPPCLHYSDCFLSVHIESDTVLFASPLSQLIVRHLSATEPLVLRFSKNMPIATWDSKGHKSVSDCLDVCSKDTMSFMMLLTVSESTKCWCAPDVDKEPLDDNFPMEKGYFEVIDITPMTVGMQSTVTYEGGLEITSKSLPNNYFSFTSKLKRELLVFVFLYLACDL